MNAKKSLELLAPVIDKVVEQTFTEEFNRVPYSNKFVKDLIDSILPLTRGGKRLRGALLYYSYLMFGGRDMDKILKAAAFIELIHIYILIMDDVIDQDNVRHSVPTVHKVFNDYHLKNFKLKDSYHFGESIAICAGITLNHVAENILFNAGFDPKLVIKALKSFNKGLAYTGFGEALDIVAEVKDSITERDAIQINLLKTAKYTYENPLHIGAILAGAKVKDLEALSEYAIPAGIAFQIQDDILGMFGDAKKLGKPEDSDLKEGKRNVLIIGTLRMANATQRKRFLELLGNPNISKSELEEARTIIKDCGAFDYAKEKAKAYVRKAQATISTNHSHWETEGREFIEGIADYMINREF